MSKDGWLQSSFDNCTLTSEYQIPRGIPVRPKGQAAGQGRHDLRKERAIDLAPDGAAYSIAPQAMTLVGDNDTPFVKARPEAGHGRFRLR
jgi:hypothetical protein